METGRSEIRTAVMELSLVKCGDAEEEEKEISTLAFLRLSKLLILVLGTSSSYLLIHTIYLFIYFFEEMVG